MATNHKRKARTGYMSKYFDMPNMRLMKTFFNERKLMNFDDKVVSSLIGSLFASFKV
jgi:hypothetical protein